VAAQSLARSPRGISVLRKRSAGFESEGTWRHTRACCATTTPPTPPSQGGETKWGAFATGGERSARSAAGYRARSIVFHYPGAGVVPAGSATRSPRAVSPPCKGGAGGVVAAQWRARAPRGARGGGGTAARDFYRRAFRSRTSPAIISITPSRLSWTSVFKMRTILIPKDSMNCWRFQSYSVAPG
jgi:hypothetical protein